MRRSQAPLHDKVRTIAAVAALTLCGFAHTDEAELKVLGFTFGKPPPPGAVFISEYYGFDEAEAAVVAVVNVAARYKSYVLPHRWCKGGAFATTDNNKVIMVRCEALEHYVMHIRLEHRYGDYKYIVDAAAYHDDIFSLRPEERKNWSSVWITPAGLCVSQQSVHGQENNFYWSWGETSYQCVRSRETAKQGTSETYKAIVLKLAEAEDF